MTADQPHRAAEAVAFFEDTVRRLRAERGDDNPRDIANEAFAAVRARYPGLTAAETRRMAEIRQFNGYSALFEAAYHRAPNTVEELYQWLATPQGRAAMREIGTAAR